MLTRVELRFKGPDGEPGTALDDLSGLSVEVTTRLLTLAESLIRDPVVGDPDEGYTPSGLRWRRAAPREDPGGAQNELDRLAEEVAGYVYVFKPRLLGGWVVLRVIANAELARAYWP